MILKAKKLTTSLISGVKKVSAPSSVCPGCVPVNFAHSLRNYLEWCFYYSYSYCFERFLLACVVMNCHSSSSLSPFFVSHLVLNSTHGFKDIRGEGYCWYLGISRTDFHVDLYLKKNTKIKKIPRARITFWKWKDQNQVIFFTSP